jgi:arylsulfatase A-like enzyme
LGRHPQRHDRALAQRDQRKGGAFGNRGIYHKGWTAVTRHRIPWEFAVTQLPAFDDDVWELYDTTTDWTGP